MTTGAEDLLGRLRQLLLTHGLESQKICVALSGGMDSMALLHALALLRPEMPYQLSALHVNHGISANANDWAKFCERECAQLAVPCETVVLLPLKACGGGLERAAREARYAAFAEIDADVLCMAHHQNDRAETLLLNLFRGAGLQGLAAMPSARFLGNKRLIRPFIDHPRSALKEWSLSQDIRWIEDESNNNLHYRRNYLRHVVLPAIEQQFPAVQSVLARTAAQMQEQTSLLARLAASDAATAADQDGHLVVSRLILLPSEAVRNVLKHRLNAMGVHIPAARRLEALAEQLRGANAGSEILVRFGELGCHVWRDRLWLDDVMNAPIPCAEKLAPGTTAWPDGQLIINQADLDRGQGGVLKAVGQGQRFQPDGRCRGSVSEMLREQGIPSWVRSRLPALWVNDQLCWIAGLGFSEQGKALSENLNIAWQAKPIRRL